MPRAQLRLALVLGASIWFTVRVVRDVRAQAPAEPIALEYEGAKGCPPATRFESAFEQHTTRARLVPGPEALGRTIRVTLKSEGRQFRGELELADGKGTTSREVGGRTCQEVVSALVFVAVLAVDPEAAMRMPEASKPVTRIAFTASDTATIPSSFASPPSQPGPIASPPSLPEPVTSSRAPVPSPSAPTPSPSPSASAPSLATASSPSASNAPPSDADAPPARTEGTTANRAPESHRWSNAGFQLAAIGGLFPDAAVAPVLFAELGEARALWAASFRFSLRGALSRKYAVSTGNAEFRWLAVGLEGCPLRFEAARALEIFPCALFEVGAVEGIGKGVKYPGSELSRWLAAGAVIRARWRVTRLFFVEAELALRFPIAPDWFVMETQQGAQVVNRPPPVSGAGAIGVGISP